VNKFHRDWDTKCSYGSERDPERAVRIFAEVFVGDHIEGVNPVGTVKCVAEKILERLQEKVDYANRKGSGVGPDLSRPYRHCGEGSTLVNVDCDSVELALDAHSKIRIPSASVVKAFRRDWAGKKTATGRRILLGAYVKDCHLEGPWPHGTLEKTKGEVFNRLQEEIEYMNGERMQPDLLRAYEEEEEDDGDYEIPF